MDNLKVGSFLQALRKAKGLTQSDVADYFEISNKTVSKWECGSALPEIPMLKALAEYYDVTVDEILNGAKAVKNEEVSEKKKKDNATFKECVSPSGFKVLIGKNNRQNDLLTTCVATKSNLWFHVKNIPGSHVILCCDSNNVADEDIVFAARQAAKHSKAAASSNVAVDYTPVKFVKKPNGAKPGMVIYSTNKTVFVDPQEKSALSQLFCLIIYK